jgi:polyhydroxyalkanoate synthase
MIKGELDEWLGKASEQPGSWWPDWLQWLKDQNAETVPARQPGGAAYPPIEDAPGSYVKMRS